MSRILSSRALNPLVGLAGIALWLALFWRGPLINDVGWQLWIGRQLNGGAILYRDIMEVNPPWWFWLSAAVDRGATVTGLTPFHALLLLFGMTALGSLALCWRLLDGEGERRRTTVALLAVLFLTSPFALGQREQFALLTIAPYVLLSARRANGRATGAGLALAIGALAASGLLLKHYFLLVPLALEAWLLVQRRWTPIRPELVALVLAGILYGGAILLFAPSYLTVMVPMIRTAYHVYDPGLAAVLLQPILFAALLGSLSVLAAPRADKVAKAAAIAALAFVAAYLWQAKGFAYHLIPALGLALLAIALALPAIARARPMVKVAVALALSITAVIPFREGARANPPSLAVTAGLAPGTAVMMLSASGVAAWPTVWERQLAWPSRHMTYWMLAAVWKAEQDRRRDLELDAIGKRIRREAAEDIVRHRPAIVMVDTRYDDVSGGVFRWFLADPAFATAMGAYRRAPDSGYLWVYRKVAP